MLASEACNIPELGEAYYDEMGMINIIGLSQLRRQYRVIYDFDKERAFFIQMKGKIRKFSEISDGLYALSMEKKNNEIMK